GTVELVFAPHPSFGGGWQRNEPLRSAADRALVLAAGSLPDGRRELVGQFAGAVRVTRGRPVADDDAPAVVHVAAPGAWAVGVFVDGDVREAGGARPLPPRIEADPEF